MEANRKQCSDFNITVNGEEWHVEMTYIQANGDPAWYVASIFRDGVKFMRDFGPDELTDETVPIITKLKCELCNDTGYYGDNGPGIKGNREYIRCECRGKE